MQIHLKNFNVNLIYDLKWWKINIMLHVWLTCFSKSSTHYIDQKSQMLVHGSLHWLGSHTMPKHGMLAQSMFLLGVWNCCKGNFVWEILALKNFTKDKGIISSHFEWNGLVVELLFLPPKNKWVSNYYCEAMEELGSNPHRLKEPPTFKKKRIKTGTKRFRFS